MKFIRLNFYEEMNGKTRLREVIANINRITEIKKGYPNRLNPQSPYYISIMLGRNYFSVKFTNKQEAEDYFAFVMEKLRAFGLKTIPW